MNTDFVIPGKAEALAAQFDAQADDLSVAYTQMKDGAQWIVTVSDLPMKIWTQDGVPHCLWTTLHEATRFETNTQASANAVRIVNGRGDRGVAVQVARAYQDAILHLRNMAAELRANAE